MYYNKDAKCSTCKQKFSEQPLVETLQADCGGRIQVRGECPTCRTWVKWIPYSESRYVSNILKVFYNNDMEALKQLRVTAIISYDKKEIQ